MHQPGVIIRATVVSTSPLTIRETVGGTPLPAKLMSGTSYSPSTTAPASRCLATFIGDRYYVIGGA